VATEHEYLVEEMLAVPLGEQRRRFVLPGTLRVVMLGKDNDSHVPFKIFGGETVATIQNTLENDGRVFVYSARRGLASLIGCLDCGHILRDPASGTPLSLHASSEDGIEKRWLYSSASGYRIPASDICPVCGGWRLRERGIGVQAVMRELQEHFPKKTPLLFDHTTASTHKKARAIEAAFYEQGSTILVGTSFALPYLDESVECSVIASMDSLLALPSWRQAEDAFGILLSLREKTLHTVIAQTRHNATHDILEYAASGDTSTFYTNEFALRKQYLYPPYAVFVLLSYRGKKAAVASTEHDLVDMFKEYDPECYGTPFSEDGLFMRRCLMRFPKDQWPNEKVVSLLRALPPHIKLEINPDRIV
jgi:primosomal protein N' (replication factor Y)